jgi:hypothetical protein
VLVLELAHHFPSLTRCGYCDERELRPANQPTCHWIPGHIEPGQNSSVLPWVACTKNFVSIDRLGSSSLGIFRLGKLKISSWTLDSSQIQTKSVKAS